jgi:dTMP kinase
VTYVVLDGPDGGGKSSQARELAKWLAGGGRQVSHLREPGSTPVGEALRKLLLSRDVGHLEPITEALLFSAARAEMVAKVVAPAVQRGDVVIAERCWLSTVVYQGLASTPGLDVDWLFDVTRRVHGALLPDAIFVLDVPPEVGHARRGSRTEDRIEARGGDYHRRVREGFLRAAALEVRAHVVDASRSLEAVQEDLRARVGGLLS